MLLLADDLPGTGDSDPVASGVPVGSGVLSRRAAVRGLLDRLGAARARRLAADVELFVGAVEYADLVTCFSGPVEDLLGAGPGQDELTASCLPQVTDLAELSIEAPAELGTALGLTSYGVSRLLADGLQVRHRLPLTWALVVAGRIEIPRVRDIARATALQPDDVVAVIDEQLSAMAGRVGPVVLARLLDEAMMRLHPEEREIRQQERLDARHATLRQDISDGGVAHMEISADLKDLLEFDHTLTEVAQALVAVLAQDGVSETFQVRRTMALGVLADPQGAADLLAETHSGPAPESARRAWPGRDGWPADRPHPAEDPETVVPPVSEEEGGLPEPPEDDHIPDDLDDLDDPVEGCPRTFTAPVEKSGEVDAQRVRELIRDTLRRHPLLPPADPPGDPWGEPPNTPRGRPGRSGKPVKQLVIYAHVSEEALHGRDVAAPIETPGSLGTVDQTGVGTGHPILAEVLREWAGRRDTHLTIRPVIDLAGHERADAYEIGDRLREQVVLRDGHCAFPWCRKPARRCDLDHIVAYNHRDPAAGGATCPCNLAPLCRYHHNLKTHHRWSYLTVEPGTWLWTSPLGYTFLVDPDGTRNLTPPGHDPGDGCHHATGRAQSSSGR